MSIYKRGSTIRILLDEFTEAEWEAVYPFDEAKAEANLDKDPDLLEYAFEVITDEAAKSIILKSVSADLWPEGDYRLDVRFTREGEHIFVPATEYVKFKIIRPVTDDEVEP